MLTEESRCKTNYEAREMYFVYAYTIVYTELKCGNKGDKFSLHTK